MTCVRKSACRGTAECPDSVLESSRMDYILLGLVLLLTALVVNLYLSLRHYKRIDYRSLIEEETRLKAIDQRLVEVSRLLEAARAERDRLREELTRVTGRAPQSVSPDSSRRWPASEVEFTSAVYKEAARMLEQGTEPWRVAQTMRLSMSEVETLVRLSQARGRSL